MPLRSFKDLLQTCWTKLGTNFLIVKYLRVLQYGAIANSIKVGISTITEQQARLMTNYTSPVPGHEDSFIVELDVFHQLHCLVSVQSIMSFSLSRNLQVWYRILLEELSPQFISRIGMR